MAGKKKSSKSPGEEAQQPHLGGFQPGVDTFKSIPGINYTIPDTHGVLPSSNFGAIPFSPGAIPFHFSGMPANAGGAAPVCIYIVPGGGQPPPATITPPNWTQPQPSTSGSTQTVDLPRSYWENYLQHLKYQKEMVAGQLGQIENLMQSIQLHIKKMETGREKKD